MSLSALESQPAWTVQALGSHSLCDFLNASPVVSEDTASLVSSIPAGSHHLSASSSSELPEPWGGEINEDITFRSLTHSLTAGCPVVGRCVSSYLLKEETSLTMAQHSSDLSPSLDWPHIYFFGSCEAQAGLELELVILLPSPLEC